MKLSKKQWFFLLCLSGVFFLLNSTFFWKLMYPIQYQDEVDKAAHYFDIDPHLVLAIVQVESKFNHERFSKKGARGLMQLMPETAKWANKESGLHIAPSSYINDPKSNIQLGSWYISFLLNKYEGDIAKAIVAYNAGPGNVDRWLQAGIWDGSDYRIDQVPIGETRHYVARVMYYYKRYQIVYEHDFN